MAETQQSHDRTIVSRIGNSAKMADAYAPSFDFWLPGGQQGHQSYGGLLMTVMLMLFLCFYGIMQSVKLYEYDETDIMISSRDSFFTSDFVYTNHLSYAFGITAYDSNREPIEDASYGVVKPYYKSWGIKAGIGGVDWEELPTRTCSQAELHVNDASDPDSPFFKPHKSSARDLGFYYKKLKCLSSPEVQVQGDYNSPKARSFAILFEKCDNSTFTGPGLCKSDEQIKQWLARKFIVINMNQIRFSTSEYDERKVTEEAKFIYIPVNSQIREEVVHKV